jgi:RNA polymerase sigma factor (sigma-70 family)
MAIGTVSWEDNEGGLAQAAQHMQFMEEGEGMADASGRAPSDGAPGNRAAEPSALLPDRRLTAAAGASVVGGESLDGMTRALLAQLPGLRRYATALVGNAADADDLVQDCVERALARRDTLRDPQSLGRWLRVILHNLHVTALRRRSATGVPVDDLAEDLALSAPPENRDQIRDLVRAMAGLSVEHRQILLLITLEGLSYREVAETLDVPIGTVMSRLARARERLRCALEGEEDRAERRVK